MNPQRRNADVEFYVGYLPKAPSGLGKMLVRIVIGLNILATVLVLVIVFAQAPFEASRFEFLQYREFEGVYSGSPYPSLFVSRSGATAGYSRYLLSAPGKHGFVPESALEARGVRLTGSLIYRGADTMIEVLPGSVKAVAGAAIPGMKPIDLGRAMLHGEIVDTKCFLGVMNPGNGKVHRDCAVRCISGGLPPGFLVRESGGRSTVLLLSGRDGRPLNREVLEFVGEPIRIDGQVLRLGETLMLRAEPAEFYRTK